MSEPTLQSRVPISMTRHTSTSLLFFSILILLQSNSIFANEAAWPIAHSNSALAENMQQLDQLLQAGLISNALYARRQSALALSITEINNKADRLKLYRAPSDIATQAKRFFALVVGSNEYEHFDSLDTAINDARAIGDLLQNKFGFDVQVIENPTRHDLLGALSTLRETLSVNDNFLLFYAGHGYLDASNNRGYWLPVDAEADNPANWVSTVEISDALLALPAAQALVIADSCFAGSLAGDVPDHAAFRPAVRRDELESTRSRTAITSGGLEPVLDTIDGRHSVFTAALIKHLNDYRRGMTMKSLYERTAKSVRQLADQTPGYFVLPDAGHQSGEFTLPDMEYSNH